MTGGLVGGHEEQFGRPGPMATPKFIKVSMYVNKFQMNSLMILAVAPLFLST